ncbi:hypothetical protein HYPSUDRAFT_48522 [Hypholoma sublateritium FD-334 SS-4]|uniref:DUF7330 domain-containing protein n=1 Tax=Hypholoma sublateritium (strain FD-334 SS-4) TaxID=945553 RepID=A0A0D2P483_HYPSF|nr:hypothetical protein HYPSUDRAFT_48522 [Hypholoma sublateritium FD-334 SS-4]
MIVVPDDQEANKPAAGTYKVNRSPEVDIDPPPGYSELHEAYAESPTAARYPPAPPNIKPSNFIRIMQPNARIKASWIIDPALRIPTAFLPPLLPNETAATRQNLNLETRNGTVDADVYVMPTRRADRKPSNQRLIIHTSSTNGTVTTTVHDVVTSESEKTRLPLLISTSSANGRVFVYIPRSFQGLVRAEIRNGSLRYSSDVQALLTPLSDFNRTQRAFIGHLDTSKLENNAEWTGDELIVRAANGNVRISFDDEVDRPPTPIEGGFWTRLFWL